VYKKIKISNYESILIRLTKKGAKDG